MRHRIAKGRLSKNTSHRKALLTNTAKNLLVYQRIETTLAKAKESRRLAERLITLGKKDTLHSRRLAYKILGDRSLVKRLFSEIAPLFKDRSGGFTRIVRLRNRVGDGANIVILELVEKIKIEEVVKPKKEKVKEDTIDKKTDSEAKLEDKAKAKEEKIKVKEEKSKEATPEKKVAEVKEKPSKLEKKEIKVEEEKKITVSDDEEVKPKKKPGIFNGFRKFFKK